MRRFTIAVLVAVATLLGSFFLAHSATSLPFLRPATFEGVIPCADCPDIRIALTLNADGTYSLVREYLERTAKSTETGKWEYNDGDSKLTLRAGGNAAPEYFSMSIGPTLRMLDAQGKIIQSSLNYTLFPAVHDTYARASLESGSWRLIEIEGKPFKPASEGQDATLTFHPREKRISGSGGCNRISGSYDADGNKLHFGPIASTRSMCPPDVMDKEATFLQTLELVASYKIAGGVLSLSGAGGTLLAKLTAEK